MTLQQWDYVFFCCYSLNTKIFRYIIHKYIQIFAQLIIFFIIFLQQLSRDEVNDILDKSNGKMEYSELQQLNYLERCIKESLRLYPSVPFISRRIDSDIQLSKHNLSLGKDLASSLQAFFCCIRNLRSQL